MMLQECTQTELADLVGYSRKQLYNINRELPDEKKFFVMGEGEKYDLSLFVKRWAAYCVDKATSKTNSFEKAKTAHEVIKTEKTQLEVQRLRGELVDVQEIRQLWGRVINDAMKNLLNLPKKIAPTLTMIESSETIADMIDVELRSALTDISETPLPDFITEMETETEEDE